MLVLSAQMHKQRTIDWLESAWKLTKIWRAGLVRHGLHTDPMGGSDSPTCETFENTTTWPNPSPWTTQS